jgi:hypothetical protein
MAIPPKLGEEFTLDDLLLLAHGIPPTEQQLAQRSEAQQRDEALPTTLHSLQT